jgi:hypothetical protein
VPDPIVKFEEVVFCYDITPYASVVDRETVGPGYVDSVSIDPAVPYSATISYVYIVASTSEPGYTATVAAFLLGFVMLAYRKRARVRAELCRTSGPSKARLTRR